MAFEESFFLKGANKTIVTEGNFKWVRTPAAEGADLSGSFQSDVKNAFHEARGAGIENPIIAGVIPFDPKQESALFVPKSWKSFDSPQEALSQQAITDRGSSETPVEVVNSTDNQAFDGYTGIVETAVEKIKSGDLDKVVLARLRDIDISQPISSADIISRLAEQNPTGFTFQVPLPDNESRLVGASPELLIRKSGSRFNSQPLAGSAARVPNKDKEVTEKLFNSKKDRFEHKLVVDSMKSTLSGKSAKLNVPDEPECISTSKLWHLATSISGEAANSDENVLALACLLHPTPALSGFPHDNARKLLTSLEPFDREFFGGIVGYCDSNGDGEWYIAIRCGKLGKTSIRLFAGAGIVQDSDPKSEWNETEVKLSTMMHVLCPQ